MIWCCKVGFGGGGREGVFCESLSWTDVGVNTGNASPLPLHAFKPDQVWGLRGETRYQMNQNWGQSVAKLIFGGMFPLRHRGAFSNSAVPFISWPPTHTRVEGKRMMSKWNWEAMDWCTLIDNGTCFALWHFSKSRYPTTHCPPAPLSTWPERAKISYPTHFSGLEKVQG